MLFNLSCDKKNYQSERTTPPIAIKQTLRLILSTTTAGFSCFFSATYNAQTISHHLN
jgi:hypothetical protein